MRAEGLGTDRVGERGLPEGSIPCDVCGGPTREARCKIICLRCGYTRDCSDP